MTPQTITGTAFATMTERCEVEVRTLSGESWCVVPDGDRVADLRASIAAVRGAEVKGALLFAEGERLDDEQASLPSPSTGGRLTIHITPTDVEVMEDEDSEAPDSPAVSTRVGQACHPDGTAGPAAGGTTAQTHWSWQAIAWVVVLVVIATTTVRMITPPQVGRPGDAKPKATRMTPRLSTRLLGMGTDAMTARMAIDATSNRTKFPLAATSKPASISSVADAAHTPEPPRPTLGLAVHGARTAPASPRPVLSSLSLSAALALRLSPPPTPPVSAASHADAPVTPDSSASTSASSAASNETTTIISLEALWRATRDLSTPADTTAADAQVMDNVVAQPQSWHERVIVGMAKWVPLASTVALWRPIGKRLIVLLLVLGRRLLPARLYEALARSAEKHDLGDLKQTSQDAKKKL